MLFTVPDTVVACSTASVCADCDAENPAWASSNLMVFLCTSCAGCHRALGSRHSRVRSLTLDSWSANLRACLDACHSHGGSPNDVWEANPPPVSARPPRSDGPSAGGLEEREAFIRRKYEQHEFCALESIPGPSALRDATASADAPLQVLRLLAAGAHCSAGTVEALESGRPLCAALLEQVVASQTGRLTSRPSLPPRHRRLSFSPADSPARNDCRLTVDRMPAPPQPPRRGAAEQEGLEGKRTPPCTESESSGSGSDDGIATPEGPRVVHEVAVHEVAGLANFAGRLAEPETWFEPGDSPARLRPSPTAALGEEGAKSAPCAPRRRSPVVLGVFWL